MINTKREIVFLIIVVLQHSLFIVDAFSTFSTGIHHAHAAPSVGPSIKSSSQMVMKTTLNIVTPATDTSNNLGFKKRATSTSMALFAEMLSANNDDYRIISEANVDTSIGTDCHISTRANDLILLPFSLSTVANPLIKLRNRQRKTKSLSMVSFAEALYENENHDDSIMSQTDNDCEPIVLKKTTITHCETHKSRLSDTSTFEFERRNHKEVEDDIGGLYASELFHTVSGVGVGDDTFVQEEFEQGFMAFSKAEFDKINSIKEEEEEDIVVDHQISFKEKLEAEKAKLISYYSMSSDSTDRYFAILLGLNMIQLRPNINDQDCDQRNDNGVNF